MRSDTNSEHESPFSYSHARGNFGEIKRYIRTDQIKRISITEPPGVEITGQRG